MRALNSAQTSLSTGRQQILIKTVSYLFTAFWIGVCLLHAVLLARRLTDAVWDYSALLRIGLGFTAVTYASLKIGRIQTAFDNRPRRAIVLMLVLILLHALIANPTSTTDSPSQPLAIAVAVLTGSVLAAGLLGNSAAPVRQADRLRRDGVCLRGLPEQRSGASCQSYYPILYQRPPPPTRALA